jgi:hypothetical protein
MQDVFHHDPVQLALGDGPGDPADKAVDRITTSRFVQRELAAAPVELVASILQAVRPRDQDLAPARGADLVGPYPSTRSRLPAEYERSPPPTSTITAC